MIPVILFPIAILAMSQGDERAFMERLYIDHRRMMFAQAYQVLRDRAAAEEAVNEACMLIIRKIPELQAKSRCTLRSYLVSTVRNVAINAYNRRQREQDLCSGSSGEWIDELPSGDVPVETHLIRQEQIDAMDRALMALPEREREMLRMKYFDELTDAEIAPLFGVKPDSVRMILSRARKQVKALMGGEGYD